MNRNYSEMTPFPRSFRSISSVFKLDQIHLENTLSKALKYVDELGRHIDIKKSCRDMFDAKMRPLYDTVKTKITFLNEAYQDIKMYIIFLRFFEIFVFFIKF